MNCSQVHSELPELVYGDVNAAMAARLSEHLAGCQACQRQRAALEQVHCLLNEVPAKESTVDLPRLYRQALLAQQQTARRRRRVAVAASGIAAAFLLGVLTFRMEFRFENHQFVIRWGNPPRMSQPEPTPTPPVTVTDPHPQPEIDEQLRILGELVQVLVKDGETRDRSWQTTVARLHRRIDGLQRTFAEQTSATERDIKGIYTLQTALKDKE